MKFKKSIAFALAMVMLFTGNICFKNNVLAIKPPREMLTGTCGNTVGMGRVYFIQKVKLEMQRYQDQFTEPAQRVLQPFGMVISVRAAYERVCDEVDAGINPTVIIDEVLNPNDVITDPRGAALDANEQQEILHQMRRITNSLETMKEVLTYLRSLGDELSGVHLKNAMSELYDIYKTAYALI